MLKFTYILSLSLYNLLFTKLLFMSKNFNSIIDTKKLGFSKWTIDEMQKFCKYVEYFAKKLGIKSCFVKSVCKRNFLKKKGFDCKLYIGVEINNSFKSHSWIISEGLNCYEEPGSNQKIIQIVD